MNLAFLNRYKLFGFLNGCSRQEIKFMYVDRWIVGVGFVVDSISSQPRMGKIAQFLIAIIDHKWLPCILSSAFPSDEKAIAL